MTEPRTPRLRSGPVPDDAMLAIRGHDPSGALEIDAEDFCRRYRDWGHFGISAFLAENDAEIDALLETRLGRFPSVWIFAVGDLRAAGLEVVPTFRRPHVTIAHENLSRLLEGLSICDHRNRENPYYLDEPEGE